MQNLIRMVAPLSLAIVASGCTTHLETIEASPNHPETRRGIAYFLPFTQFHVKTTWTVSSCEDEIKVVPKVSIAAANTPDPAKIYVIDYQSLNAWTKTSSVKVEFYDSGSIKSINASADDRTGEIAAKVISAVGKVAAFGAAGGQGDKFTCNAATTKALRRIGTQKAEIDRLTALLARHTEALDIMTARVIRSGNNAPRGLRNALDSRIGAVVATQLEFDRAKAQLEEMLEEVTFSVEIDYPERSDQTTPGELELSAKALKGWIAQDPGNLAAYLQEQKVYVELASLGDWQKGVDYPNDNKSNRLAGVRYRVAIPGKLRACRNAPCSMTDGLTPPETIEDFPVRILQAGTTFYLPFKSAPFSNAALSATFTEAGVLTSAGYEQKRAPGEVMANIADLLADQVVTVGGKIRETRVSELDKIKDETALAQARKELADAQKALTSQPSAVAEQSATLTADTALKEAELANIKAELALKAARSERDALLGEN